MLKTLLHFRGVTSAACFAAILAGGCAQQVPQTQRAALPPPKPHAIEFANLTARTTAVDSAPAVSPDEFLARVQALLQMGATPSRIQRLVQRFPDAALEVLRNTSSAQATQPARIATAAAYDRAFVVVGASGWANLLSEAAAHKNEYEAFQQSRLLALQFIEMGRPERVAHDVGQPGDVIVPIAKAELLRLRGIAALLCDKPADAQRDWQSAVQLAAADRSVCAELHLLMAEGLRHQNSNAAADGEWSSAAVLAATIHDPSLWQRILDAKDPTSVWPAETTAAFQPDVNATTDRPDHSPLDPSRTEPCIWRQIGEWHLARGETPPALLAFKQSESLFTSPRDRAEARIAEARALLLMNQSGAAVSILTSLAVDQDPIVSHHALAVLGNARIALDDIPGALTLLNRAVKDDDTFPQSLRASARADLGLVCLMSWRETEGLTWLHKAQADFERQHDNAGLVQCLRNEAAYLNKVGRAAEADTITDRANLISALP